MKKYVNGKIVDIHNIGVFELGFEGLALNSTVTSRIVNPLDGEPQIVRVCVEQYNKMYNSLPFPLYAVESNVKYCAMALYIQDRVATILKGPVELWVDKGIVIPLSDARALKITGNTWGIVNISAYDGELTDEQKDSINLETYCNDDGYAEFKWCLIKLMNGESLNGFYGEFLKGFEEACMSQPMVMKWELGRLLDFGHLPDKQDTEVNMIRNIENGKKYQIDVFWTGRTRPVSSGEKVMVFDMTSGGRSSYVKTKEEKEYNFDIYEIKDNGARRKLKEEKLAFSGLLYTIVELGKEHDRVERVTYSGLTDGDIMAFNIEGTLYLGAVSNRLNPIGTGVELWAIEKSKVYMKKELKLENGVTKCSYYNYDIKADKLKLCKLEYR